MNKSAWTIEFDPQGGLVGVCLFGTRLGCCRRLAIWNSAEDRITRLQIDVVLGAMDTQVWKVARYPSGAVSEVKFNETPAPGIETAEEDNDLLKLVVMAPFEVRHLPPIEVAA